MSEEAKVVMAYLAMIAFGFAAMAASEIWGCP